MLVIGLDGATWKVINTCLDDLPNIKSVIKAGEAKTITVKGKPLSVPAWCSIFSGVAPEQHGHEKYVINGKLLAREDIMLEFIWDILYHNGKSVYALNVPFVLPTYSFNTTFKSIGYGLPDTEEEWIQELSELTKAAKSILQRKPDLLCVVYTILDRMQHYYWGEPEAIYWYKEIDAKIGELLPYDDKIIIVSDHGFCSFGDAKIKTLNPIVTNGRAIKGDHHQEAILITKNISYPIKNSEDVFYAIKNECCGGKIYGKR